jgi:hypothetical protein
MSAPGSHLKGGHPKDGAAARGDELSALAAWGASLDRAVGRGLSRVTGTAIAPYQSAVVRIGFALTELLFLLREYPHRDALYGPGSPWGLDLAKQLLAGNHAFTVLVWSDSRAWFELVYAVAVLSAAALLVGWRTRTASLIFMVGVLSLQNRSVFMGDGGDNVIHLMAIYLAFTRCGQVWSLDHRRAVRRAAAERAAASEAAAGPQTGAAAAAGGAGAVDGPGGPGGVNATGGTAGTVGTARTAGADGAEAGDAAAGDGVAAAAAGGGAVAGVPVDGSPVAATAPAITAAAADGGGSAVSRGGTGTDLAGSDLAGIVLWVGLGAVLLAATAGGKLTTGWGLIFWACWAGQAMWWAVRRYAPGEPRTVLDIMANIVHNGAMLVIAAEVCLIYSTAGWYKIQGGRWQDGTALYYPLHLDDFTPWPTLSHALAGNDVMVMVITYVTVMVQVAFPFTVFNRRVKNVLLVMMMLEHASIAVVLGLPFFSLAMIAADAVFLPTGFLRWLGKRVTGAVRRGPETAVVPAQRVASPESAAVPAAGPPPSSAVS